jgi:branched-chain amino acid transport system substrate-binding protein
MCSAALLVLSAACTTDDDDEDATANGGTAGTAVPVADDLLADCPDDIDTAGIDGDTITLVSSFPQEGALAAFAEIAKGYNAYFDMVNEEGGVEVGGTSYQIEVETFNDNYNPPETVEAITNAFGPDGTGAFAAFSVVGTANNIAIRDDLDELCVPNIFASTGSPAMGNPAYPWMVGSTLPLYSTEAASFAAYLEEEMPEATVAMLLQNGEFGDGYEASFLQAIEGTDIEVVATERYDAGLTTDVSAQVTNLAATGADVFFNGATLLPCPSALTKADELGWDAMTYVSGTCASKTLIGAAGPAAAGALTATNIMDPSNDQWSSDERMVLYKETVDAWRTANGVEGADVENGVVAYGWTLGYLFVEALEQAPELTRSNVMEAVMNLQVEDPGLVFPGITLETGAGDRYLGESVQIVEYDIEQETFVPVGEIRSFEGGEAIPEALITAS